MYTNTGHSRWRWSKLWLHYARPPPAYEKTACAFHVHQHRSQQVALEHSVAALRKASARLKALAAKEAAYAALPISGHLLAMRVKALTKEVGVT